MQPCRTCSPPPSPHPFTFKLQEEERERRMDFVPEESAINVDNIEVRAAARESGGLGIKGMRRRQPVSP